MKKKFEKKKLYFNSLVLLRVPQVFLIKKIYITVASNSSLMDKFFVKNVNIIINNMSLSLNLAHIS